MSDAADLILQTAGRPVAESHACVRAIAARALKRFLDGADDSRTAICGVNVASMLPSIAPLSVSVQMDGDIVFLSGDREIHHDVWDAFSSLTLFAPMAGRFRFAPIHGSDAPYRDSTLGQWIARLQDALLHACRASPDALAVLNSSGAIRFKGGATDGSRRGFAVRCTAAGGGTAVPLRDLLRAFGYDAAAELETSGLSRAELQMCVFPRPASAHARAAWSRRLFRTE